jgi:thioredoxin-dependent peroxiredoxin
MDLKHGDKAPAFKLATDGGGEVSLAGLKGQPFVLYFYPRDNTSGCTREAVNFTRLARKFQNLGVAVIGVSRDSTTSHDRFKEKHGLNVTLGSDPETKMAQDYGVWIEKTLYGRTSMGMERATFLIDKAGKIRAIWRKVKVDGHAEAVLAAAQDL